MRPFSSVKISSPSGPTTVAVVSPPAIGFWWSTHQAAHHTNGHTHGVRVLEDCAQAHGARDATGKAAGAFGDIASFSFYPTKNLGALGDGGAVATSDPALATRTRQLRQYGWTAKYTNSLEGGRNTRLDELQAALLLEMLPELDKWNARRRHIANRYSA